MNTPKDRLIKVFEVLRFDKKISSQTDFGNKLELNKSQFSQIMTGKRAISANTVAKLQTTFNVNPKYILKGEGEMFIDNARMQQALKIATGNASVKVEDLGSEIKKNDEDHENINVGTRKFTPPRKKEEGHTDMTHWTMSMLQQALDQRDKDLAITDKLVDTIAAMAHKIPDIEQRQPLKRRQQG